MDASDFIYLDEQKVYSLSSQVFEGFIESVVNERSSTNQEGESTSKSHEGKFLADLMLLSEKTEEKKMLHDHSYTILEKRLIEDGLVCEVGANGKLLDGELDNLNFVKIKSTVLFVDSDIVLSDMEMQYESGKAVASSVMSANFRQLHLEKLSLGSKDKKAVNERISDLHRQIEKTALDKGLVTPEEEIKGIKHLYGRAHNSIFEALFNGGGKCFTAILDRSCLRDSVRNIYRKYSYFTEQKFTVLGVVTKKNLHDLDSKLTRALKRIGKDSLEDELPEDDVPRMREQSLSVSIAQFNMDEMLNKLLENEIVIDPIAIYLDML